ncbi:MAG: thiamine-phosphate kinase [Sumerlaeia bacterium]
MAQDGEMQGSISFMGEQGIIRLIQEVAEICHAAISPQLGVDDVAVTSMENHRQNCQLVWTSDSMQEGTHFRFWPLLKSTPLNWLGQKLALCNLSDLAAKGAKPRFALLNLGLPKNGDITKLREFLEGMFAVFAENHITLLGGDTYACTSWNVSLTMVGELPHNLTVPSRNYGKPNDNLYITGALGASRQGLKLLEESIALQAEAKVELPQTVLAHLYIPNRLKIGQALAKISLWLAMMDCSDGLLDDSQKLAVASGLGAKIFLEAIPVDPRLTEAVPDEKAARQIALLGGEDYELLFASPLNPEELIASLTNLSVTDTPIGQIGFLTEDKSYLVVDEDNRPISLNEIIPFKHF